MENFDLRKYLADNALLKEHSEVENWDNMGEEERLYTLLKYIDDPDEAESYVDASFHELPNTVSAQLSEVFDPEGDYDIKYEIEDYDIGDKVVVLPSLTHDPIDKQGETGVIKDIYHEDSMIEVEFDDGQLGYYMAGFVVFPGDEGYEHPEDDEVWVDPAGGTHYGDEDDPAAAYIEESFDLKEYLGDNKLLTEGQFSWMTMDTGEQIGSESENTIDVYMVDNEGNSYHEPKYEGYGNFGGKDYYDVLAIMNGFTQEDVGIKNKDGHPTNELRDIGIQLAFEKIDPKEGEVLFPALVTDPSKVTPSWDFTQQPENDPNQSWYMEEEEEEDWGGYDDEDEY